MYIGYQLDSQNKLKGYYTMMKFNELSQNELQFAIDYLVDNNLLEKALDNPKAKPTFEYVVNTINNMQNYDMLVTLIIETTNISQVNNWEFVYTEKYLEHIKDSNNLVMFANLAQTSKLTFKYNWIRFSTNGGKHVEGDFSENLVSKYELVNYITNHMTKQEFTELVHCSDNID